MDTDTEHIVIPLLSIAQSLQVYKRLHAPTPAFGLDIYDPNFIAEHVLVLGNNGDGNKGIPIRCDHLVMVLCVQGTCTRRINHHKFEVRPKTVHVILPGQIHSFTNASDDFDIRILLVDTNYLTKNIATHLYLQKLLKLNSDCTPSSPLSDDAFSDWLLVFRKLETELKSKEKYSAEIMATLILNLLLQLKRKLDDPNALPIHSTRAAALLYQFQLLIEENFKSKKTVKEYASLLFISPKHLSETVKLLTGYTALHFIQERIIHEAEYLLVYSDMSIKEISYSLNFENPSHFSRFFKQKRQQTPAQFRITHQ